MVEAVLPAAHTAEEEIENSGDIDGYMAAEETETVTEAALPAPASSEASGDVTEMVTEAEDRSGPALATPERTAPRCRRCPSWPVTVTWAVSAVRGLLKENLRRKTLICSLQILSVSRRIIRIEAWTMMTPRPGTGCGWRVVS